MSAATWRLAAGGLGLAVAVALSACGVAPSATSGAGGPAGSGGSAPQQAAPTAPARSKTPAPSARTKIAVNAKKTRGFEYPPGPPDESKLI